MKSLRIYAVALLVLIAIIASALLYGRNANRRPVRFWHSVYSKVEYNGITAARADVRAGDSALMLLDLTDQENAIYVIDLKSHEVYELHDYDYQNALSMPPLTAKALARDLVVGEYRFQFTTPKNSGVLVLWAVHTD
jgi:hypothetical protein